MNHLSELMQTSMANQSSPNFDPNFLKDEYSCMLYVKRSSKPVVALAHGYAMGAVRSANLRYCLHSCYGHNENYTVFWTRVY